MSCLKEGEAFGAGGAYVHCLALAVPTASTVCHRGSDQVITRKRSQHGPDGRRDVATRMPETFVRPENSTEKLRRQDLGRHPGFV